MLLDVLTTYNLRTEKVRNNAKYLLIKTELGVKMNGQKSSWFNLNWEFHKGTARPTVVHLEPL